ncbi:hypothetical protein CBS101457_000247 [Exobasidium rhododendri]|nr:hypothetical protein CBS101457_000247 [Exobasidium rhododendri]
MPLPSPMEDRPTRSTRSKSILRTHRRKSSISENVDLLGTTSARLNVNDYSSLSRDIGSISSRFRNQRDPALNLDTETPRSARRPTPSRTHQSGSQTSRANLSKEKKSSSGLFDRMHRYLRQSSKTTSSSGQSSSATSHEQQAHYESFHHANDQRALALHQQEQDGYYQYGQYDIHGAQHSHDHRAPDSYQHDLDTYLYGQYDSHGGHHPPSDEHSVLMHGSSRRTHQASSQSTTSGAATHSRHARTSSTVLPRFSKLSLSEIDEPEGGGGGGSGSSTRHPPLFSFDYDAPHRPGTYRQEQSVDSEQGEGNVYGEDSYDTLPQYGKMLLQGGQSEKKEAPKKMKSHRRYYESDA